ncbi:hypothetical protein IV38_GL001604 [Lactobacillus selangorensis]|uniref:HTH hxlR-type domain-containing protein n=1 Tax=Lactobacillus selangorensis TaxID=81857 RepID=A0A0R2FHT4_9LACO|nr:winged helix-turn-helix transcriptional regulator [Lactobacillus selangorensis]KRN28152.1 hypothetical protein IV38_GL001604 [Lactobacillus selangorensis]KRN30972.1 hypothetical protein IV40_GL001611 [Lactobacillus selangorensis]
MAMHELSLGTKVGLSILNDRWYSLMLMRLSTDFTDFIVLRKAVRGLSTTKLLVVLTKLKQMGLVEANDDYAFRLSAHGQEIQMLLTQIEQFGNHELMHLGTILSKS